jgi:hypothetical protein
VVGLEVVFGVETPPHSPESLYLHYSVYQRMIDVKVAV